MMERKLNYRPTFEINMTEPVAQNYYPVTTAITVRDAAQQLAVLVDRAQGGAAPHTSSPTSSPLTPAPTATTSPHRSLPTTDGGVGGTGSPLALAAAATAPPTTARP